MIVMMLMVVLNAMASIARIDNFLKAEELNPNAIEEDHSLEVGTIKIFDADFSWDTLQAEWHDITSK